MFNRRQALGLGLALPGATALASCGPNSPESGSGNNSEATIRLAWWGNPTRNQITADVVDAYEKDVDSTSITLEPGEFSGYWDKLATQAAGGDLPDIIQMDEIYLTEYGSRGTLLDLAEAGLDTSEFADGAVEVGEVPGNGLAAIAAGLNAVTLMVNPILFEDAGVDIPDDTTWTWDDLIDTAVKISESTEDGIYGLMQLGTVQSIFQLWTRQLGQDLFRDGGPGFDVESATSFFEFALRIQDSGAGPDASTSVEDAAQSLDQSMFATGRLGIARAWSNEVVAYDELVPGGIAMLRPPSMSGSATGTQLWNKSSMYWSIAKSTQNPEAALSFVDYLVNSPEAGKILSVERGVPGNLTVREAILSELDEGNLKPVNYLDSIESELGTAPEIAPQGGGELIGLLQRTGEDVIFGTITPEEAGQRLVDELTAALS